MIPCFKAQLGSSAKNDEVGRIVLDQLCPAVYAILLDGLKTHVRSFFGKVKNSAWKVVEDSIDMGNFMCEVWIVVYCCCCIIFVRMWWTRKKLSDA